MKRGSGPWLALELLDLAAIHGSLGGARAVDSSIVLCCDVTPGFIPRNDDMGSHGTLGIPQISKVETIEILEVSRVPHDVISLPLCSIEQP